MKQGYRILIKGDQIKREKSGKNLKKTKEPKSWRVPNKSKITEAMKNKLKSLVKLPHKLRRTKCTETKHAFMANLILRDNTVF